MRPSTQHHAALRVVNVLAGLSHAALPSLASKPNVVLTAKETTLLRLLIDLTYRISAVGPSPSSGEPGLARVADLLRTVVIHASEAETLNSVSAELILRELTAFEHCPQPAALVLE